MAKIKIGIYEEMAEEILLEFSLDDILEMNDLSHEDVVNLLIAQGFISQPEHLFP